MLVLVCTTNDRTRLDDLYVTLERSSKNNVTTDTNTDGTYRRQHRSLPSTPLPPRPPLLYTTTRAPTTHTAPALPLYHYHCCTVTAQYRSYTHTHLSDAAPKTSAS